MRFWELDADFGEITTRFGTIDGEMQEHTEYVEGNTLRDEDEQALFKADSKIKKRIESGYRHSIEEAENYDGTNELGYHKPMKALRWDRIKTEVDYENSDYQNKYDGHRCLITNDNGKKLAYSKNGKLIHTIEHILSDMDVPEGETIDGELYIHGMKLQSIASRVKRMQPESLNLKFNCYDVVAQEDFSERLRFIHSLNLGANANVVPLLNYEGSVKDILNSAVNNGYEGLIVRPRNGFYYEDGKRSKGLIKVKKFMDMEFLITNVSASRDGWAILHCITHEGQSFTASAPGNMQEKRNALINKHIIIGRYVRVEFAMWTLGEKPFHPVATGYRQLDE